MSAGPVASEDDDVTERRATVRLKRYWLSLRRVGIAPQFREFDPRRNPVPWDNCFIVGIERSGDRLIFDHVGSALWVGLPAPALADADTKRTPPFLARLVAKLADALATGNLAEDSGAFRLKSGEFLLFRSILLPFVDLNNLPRYALGAATYKIVATPPAHETVFSQFAGVAGTSE